MSRVPRIRFKGFEEDWEQRKLGDIAERIVRKNEKLESTLPLTISAQYGLIDQNEFFDKRIASKNVRGYYLIKKGEFAYNKSTSVDAPLGAIKRLDKYKNGVLSTLYILFKIIDDTSTSSDYLVTYYATDLWHRGIQSIAAEGARNHGLLNIAPNDFFETMLSIPLNISEQKKVGDFFISLNHLITLHQRKLEKLKIIKKSMLENLFPLNGEKTPKIRFSGFTKDWEQRKFVELFLEKRDKTQSEDEDVLLSCAITGIYLNSELFSHFRGTSNIGYLKIKKNDLILSAQNLHLGNANVNLMFEHGIISPAYKVYELNECDQYFVQSWVKKDSTKDFFLNATTEGASQCRKNIDWCILNNQLIVIPSLYEQFVIGKFFNSLDHLITLHQSKLEKLQKIKKSMLESMFV